MLAWPSYLLVPNMLAFTASTTVFIESTARGLGGKGARTTEAAHARTGQRAQARKRRSQRAHLASWQAKNKDMLHPTSSRYISPGRVVFAHALPTSSAAISERSQASPGRAHISPGRTSSPGRVIFSDTLPARSARTQHEDDGLPRLAHRMGARRMRRFFNDKFMDSPVTMAAVEEDDACLQSTQLPFYQRGCHFSSEAAWLVDFNDDHTTPPPPPTAPSPRRTSTTATAASGRAAANGTPPSASAAAGREERGRSMFDRLDASDRAVQRTHVTFPRRHAADAAASHRALLAAETALRRFLLDHATASAEGTTSSSSAPAADLASPGREIASSEAGEWEHVSEADEWLLVSRAEAETTAAEDNEAVDFAVARASALAWARDSVPNSRRDGAAGRRRESRRGRRGSTRARRWCRGWRRVPPPLWPQCVLGVASDATRRRCCGRWVALVSESSPSPPLRPLP